jgi:hypothetical protein
LISLLPLSLITGHAIPDITITFSGIFFLFIIVYKNKYKNLHSNNITIISLFFWIYLILISFIAENKFLSFRDALIFIRILFIPILIFYFISVEKKHLKRIIFIIFIAVIFVTFDTLFQYTQYNSEFGFGKDLLGFKSDWYGRLTGPFGDELIPGAYLSKFSLIGLIFIFSKYENTKHLKILSIIYLSIIGFVIFASGERMAMATYLMGLFFLLIFYQNKRIIFISSLFLIIILSYGSTKIHPFYNDYKIIESTPYHLGLKVEKFFDCNNKKETCKKEIILQPEFLIILKNFNESAYGEIYSLGTKIFKDNMLFGAGLNNFTYLCKNHQKYKNIMQNYSCVSHPHNIYLQWLVEAGLFGLILFLIYLFYLFYFIIKRNFNEYSLIGISTLLILFWPIMSTGSLLKNWNGVSSFFIIGICISIYKLKEKN